MALVYFSALSMDHCSAACWFSNLALSRPDQWTIVLLLRVGAVVLFVFLAAGSMDQCCTAACWASGNDSLPINPFQSRYQVIRIELVCQESLNASITVISLSW